MGGAEVSLEGRDAVAGCEMADGLERMRPGIVCVI